MIANKSIRDAKNSTDMHPVIITIILYLIVTLPQYGLAKFLVYATKYKIFEELINQIHQKNLEFLLIIYLTSISLVLAYVFARKILKRSSLSLGLSDDEKIKSYLLGVALGMGLLALIVFILKIFGLGQIEINLQGFSLKMFIIHTLGWMIQGFEEEFVFRSIFMNQLASRGKISGALIANSMIFSIFHLGNSGFDLIAFVNIFLLGFVFSMIFYLTDSIFIPAAAHSFWNMAMANIFGIAVSGNIATEVTIFTTKLSGNTIFSGGDFGVEASLVTSFILLVLVVTLARKINNSNFKPCL